LFESDGLEPEMDLSETIGDEWADPEEFLNDYCSDDAEAENAARKHLD
jgi:DNA integrity scanning protein DisA with diadenylate cyclase activity